MNPPKHSTESSVNDEANKKRVREYKAEEQSSKQSKYDKQVVPTISKEQSVVIRSTTNKITLDVLCYDQWTNEQVISALLAPKSAGGANLSVHKLKPFIANNFDGTSLSNIVDNIQSKNGGKDYAVEQLQQNAHVVLTMELYNTCQAVVRWVIQQVMTRQLSFWLLEPVSEWIKHKLFEPVPLGGGLDFDKVSNLNGNDFFKIYTKGAEADQLDIFECLKKIREDTKLEVLEVMRLIVENTLSEAESVIEPKPINALIDEARSQQINALINASDIMPFIGNDFLLSSVEGLLLQRIVLSEGLRLKNDKTCIEIPFFAGAPGIGKTRNAVECIELVKKKNTPKLHEYLKNKVEIFLMVGKNGLKFGNFLFDNNEDLKVPLTTQLEQMITIRMCYQLCTYFFKSHFIESEWLGFKRVSQVTRFIQQCLDENRCTIVLVIDEFQLLMEYVDPITNRSGLDIVVKLLATVSSELGTF